MEAFPQRICIDLRLSVGATDLYTMRANDAVCFASNVSIANGN